MHESLVSTQIFCQYFDIITFLENFCHYFDNTFGLIKFFQRIESCSHPKEFKSFGKGQKKGSPPHSSFLSDSIVENPLPQTLEINAHFFSRRLHDISIPGGSAYTERE